MSGKSDAAMRLYRAEQESGRGVEALLDLVRGEEKLISAMLGPNQAKAFLDRVVQINFQMFPLARVDEGK